MGRLSSLFQANITIHHEGSHHELVRDESGREPDADEAQRIWRAEVNKHDRMVFVDAAHFPVLAALALPMVALLLIMVFTKPNATLGGASVACWCVYLLVALGLWPVSLLLVFIGQLVFRMLSDAESLEKVMYVVKRVSIPMALFVWDLGIFGALFLVFKRNPLPAYDDSGEEVVLSASTLEWLARILASVLIHGFVKLIKNILVSKAAMKSRNEAYYEKVQAAVRSGIVLAKLTKNLPASEFKTSKYRSSRRGSQSEVAPPASVAPLAEGQETADLTQSVMQIDWKKFDLDAKAVQESHLLVCRGTKSIASQNDAEMLGDILFNHLKRTLSNPDHLVMDDLHTAFPSTADQSFAASAFRLLDQKRVGYISRRDMQDACHALWLERKNLSRTLEGLDSIIRALDAFLTAAAYFVLLFIVLAIFASSSIGKILLSFTATFLAISFAFGESARNFFNSFVFLFMRHPFDVGDRVIIRGETESVYVHRMELLNTTFMHWDGRMFNIPNHILYGKTITNVRRSGHMTDIFHFHVDYRTPVSSLRELERGWRHFLQTRPDFFVEAKSDMFVKSLEHTNRLTIEFVAAYNTNWQYAEQMVRRHLLVLKTKELCEHLHIVYVRPTQHVRVTQQHHHQPDQTSMSSSPGAHVPPPFQFHDAIPVPPTISPLPSARPIVRFDR